MKRSNRIVALTDYFLENPRELVQLPYFSEIYQASKSSISEDLDIIDHMFQYEGIGQLQRSAGAAGGVRYIPYFSNEKSMQFVNELCHNLEETVRILTGGYLDISDSAGHPNFVCD